MIVAIDGPSGAGKSTLARMLAEMLNLAVLDTGAMYRAATWLVIHHGIDPSDEQGVTSLISSADFKIDERVMVNDVDVTDEIRTPLVTSKVSEVSAIPSVRAELVRRQRQWTEARGGGIVEGRDIGTVVFPDATLKIYLTADNAVRAARRRNRTAASNPPVRWLRRLRRSPPEITQIVLGAHPPFVLRRTRCISIRGRELQSNSRTVWSRNCGDD